MRSVLSLAVLVLAVAPATAQTAKIQSAVDKKLDAARDAERAEDIEILRRILNRSLGLPDKVSMVWPLSQWQMPGGFSGPGMNPGSTPPGGGGFTGGGFGTNVHGFPSQQLSSVIGPFDGVYLPGHGVVFTLRVPETLSLTTQPPTRSQALAATCLKCHTTEPVSKTVLEPDPNAAKPSLEEWEKVQQELRGQSASEAPKVVARLTGEQVCNPGALANQLIVKLHGNASKVRHLDPGEHISIVVTFDGLSGSAKNRVNLNVLPSGDPAAPGGSDPLPPSGRTGFTPEEVRQLTLGDLHLKQGKAKESVMAYQQALTRYQVEKFVGDPPAGFPPEKARLLAQELQKGVRDVYAKLAQAYLAAGELETAQKALEMARTFVVELPTGAKPDGLLVPAKLVVSLKLAEFKKAEGDPAAVRKIVKVETVGFPPADKAKK